MSLRIILSEVTLGTVLSTIHHSVLSDCETLVADMNELCLISTFIARVFYDVVNNR